MGREMNRVQNACILLLLLLVILAAACAPVSLIPTAEPLESVYTAAAQTVAVELTLEAGQTAVARLTEMAQQQPTPTIWLPTLPPPPPPTSTPPPPAPTSTVTPLPTQPTCDTASFVADITVPPNATFSPGERFVKIWRVQNTGDCTWTSQYTLAFSGGEGMGSPLLVSLPATVNAGQSVDVPIELVAPSTPGFHQGYWKLFDPNNAPIDIAPGPLGALWVQIQVVDTVSTSGEYDFAREYCAAQWRSNRDVLTCSGFSDDPDGAVILLADPRLESRNEDELALWMIPGQGGGGWITGEYPPMRIYGGDRFVSEIGCLRDNPDCELLFELGYRTQDGNVRTLDSWFESYDGDTREIDLDLEDLAGETVQFILSVTNQGDQDDANGFWLVPHIHNLSQRSDLVISWRQEGGTNEVCYDVKLYLTGRHDGEARARSCGGGIRESGTLRLNDAQVDLVLDWLDTFRPYEFEVETPTNNEDLVEKIIFDGEGDIEVLYEDIRSMQNFMRSLYNAIIF